MNIPKGNSGAGVCPVCYMELLTKGAQEKARSRVTRAERSRSKNGATKNSDCSPTPSSSKNLKSEEDSIIIVAECGHLFHKSCLRSFCESYKKATGQVFPNCPVCDKRLAFTKSQIVHLEAHEGYTDVAEKEYRVSAAMQKELKGQVQSIRNKIKSRRDEINYREEEYDEMESVFDMTKEDVRKWTLTYNTILQLKSADKEVDDRISRVHMDNLQLAKIFLFMASEYRDPGLDEQNPLKIPTELLPHVVKIQQTTSILDKFNQLLFPVPTPASDDPKIIIPAPTRDEVIEVILAEVENGDNHNLADKTESDHQTCEKTSSSPEEN